VEIVKMIFRVFRVLKSYLFKLSEKDVEKVERIL
jgi:hypothetical protein